MCYGPLVVVNPSRGPIFYLEITWNGDQLDDVWLQTGAFPSVQIVSNGQTVEIDHTAAGAGAGAGYSALFYFCDQLRSDFFHELLNVSGFGAVGFAGAFVGLINPGVGVAIEAIAGAGVINSSVNAFSYFRQWRDCEDCVEETGEPC